MFAYNSKLLNSYLKHLKYFCQIFQSIYHLLNQPTSFSSNDRTWFQQILRGSHFPNFSFKTLTSMSGYGLIVHIFILFAQIMVEPSSVRQIVATLLSSIAATTTTLGGVGSVISSSLHKMLPLWPRIML